MLAHLKMASRGPRDASSTNCTEFGDQLNGRTIIEDNLNVPCAMYLDIPDLNDLHGFHDTRNFIFDILEVQTFQTYNTCWVLWALCILVFLYFCICAIQIWNSENGIFDIRAVFCLMMGLLNTFIGEYMKVAMLQIWKSGRCAAESIADQDKHLG